MDPRTLLAAAAALGAGSLPPPRARRRCGSCGLPIWAGQASVLWPHGGRAHATCARALVPPAPPSAKTWDLPL